MAEPGAVTRAVLAITRDIRDDRAIAAEVCRACIAGLDIDGAAISLLTASTSRRTLYVTDATADLLEDLQFTLGEGPCVEAATTGRPVLVPDIGDVVESSRWPIYADALIVQGGAAAVFALPLQWGTINLGVLDLYRRVPGSLPRSQLLDAICAADLAALMLLGLRTDPGVEPRWDRSWGNRAEIHQATGMVMAQLGVSATHAFARLRAHAFAEQRLLGAVARDVVARQLYFIEDISGP